MAGIKSSFKNPIFKLEPFLKNRLIEKKLGYSEILMKKWYQLLKKSKKVKQSGRRLEEAYPLHMFISGLHFNHHWLFNKEQVHHNQFNNAK